MDYRFFLTIFMLLSGISHACNLSVKVSNIQSSEGELLIGIYAVTPETTSWPAEPAYTATYPKPENTTLEHCEDVTPGLYSIRVLQDLNANKLNDRNASGIPQESFGFSYQGPKAIPLISDTVFEVAMEPILVEVSLKHPQQKAPAN